MSETENSHDLVVYLASYPSENYDPSTLFSQLEQSYTVLHPSYNWENVSEKVQNLLVAKGLKVVGEPGWDFIMQRDLLGLKLSDVVVYDVDANPGPHFIMAAALLNLPVFCISKSLESIPVYFASQVKAILKPEDLGKLGGIL